MKGTQFLLVLTPLGLLSGCAASSVNQNYGKAYEQMVREQTFDVSTRDTGQGDRVLQGTDPDVANLALETMRKDTGSRTNVQSSASQSSGSSGSGSGSTGGSGSSSGN
jgi:uncharacterized membrane protein YgcG